MKLKYLLASILIIATVVACTVTQPVKRLIGGGDLAAARLAAQRGVRALSCEPDGRELARAITGN